ncbi:MAG TPA: hypothetical protein V6D22_10090 [Candidatus Obscuribacterales bacterium]
MKFRPQASNALPEGIIPWVARYSGICHCGKRIRQGTNCNFDKLTRKLVCKSCTKLAAAGVAANVPASAAQQVMDRLKQIYVMPKPLSAEVETEMEQLLLRLRTEFSSDYSARRLLAEMLGLQLKGETACIAMRYGDRCHGCSEHQLAGTAAVWCKSSHRIWCLECFAARK